MIRMMSRLCLSCIALSLLVLAGCKGTQHPTVSVVSARMNQTTEVAATVEVWLHLENPNPEPLELLEFDYSVDVDGRFVFQGKHSAQMTLAQNSTRDVEIPAVIPFEKTNWSGTVPEGAMIRVQGTLRYILPGAIAQTLFDTGVRRPRVSFKGEKPIEPAAATAATAPATIPAAAP